MDDASDELRKALASHKIEIERLNGELFAMRSLVFYYLQQASIRSPELVKAAFDNAANHTEDMTIKFGKVASPHHLAKALEIIEDFRSKIIPVHKK